MSLEHARALSDAILYEGYLLYPYRTSALKNRRDRWLFGVLRPPGRSEASELSGECIVRGGPATRALAMLRFLHPIADEALAREVAIAPIALGALPARVAFDFAPLAGELAIAATPLDGAYRLSISVQNLSGPFGDVLARSLVSSHVVLGVIDGELVSLADPPPALRVACEGCRQAGTWPALLARDTALFAPIILPDFPELAPESPGDLFDGLEIDEILSLRILTLTGEERARASRGDPRVAAMIARTEALTAEQLGRLHGALRVRGDRPPRTLRAGETLLAPGMRVVLRPRARADILDLSLAGRAATIASIEEDWDGRSYVTVTIDDDPGRDLGAEGWPGHRFFFGPDEVEPIR